MCEFVLLQLTELEAEFEKVSSGRAVPTRYLRSQQQRQQRVDETDGPGEDDGMSIINLFFSLFLY